MGIIGEFVWVTFHVLPGPAGWEILVVGAISGVTLCVIALCALVGAWTLLARRLRALLQEISSLRLAWDQRGEFRPSALPSDTDLTRSRDELLDRLPRDAASSRRSV
jgi:hypothetical protein